MSLARKKKTSKPIAIPLVKLHLELVFLADDVDDPTHSKIRFTLWDVNLQDTVEQVKVPIETDLGILRDMYYLSYLDSAPLEESSRLCEQEVVGGAPLRMNVWRIWSKLLKAAITGDITSCFSTSVDITGSSDWERYCAWAALYTASHHGHSHLVAELLHKVASLNINRKTDNGGTVVHAAARMSKWEVVFMLVENGVDVKIKDRSGLTVLDICCKYKQRNSEKSQNVCPQKVQNHHKKKHHKKKHIIAREGKMYSSAANGQKDYFKHSYQAIIESSAANKQKDGSRHSQAIV